MTFQKKIASSIRFAAVAPLLLAAYSLHAADTTWLGLDGNWTDDNNWSAGEPTNVDNAIFNNPAGITQPTELSGRQQVNVVTFNSGGWAIDVGSVDPGTLQFNQAGSRIDFTNTSSPGISQIYDIELDDDVTIDVGSGNTFILHNSGSSAANTRMIKDGVGTFVLATGGASGKVADVNAGTYLVNGTATSNRPNWVTDIASAATVGGSGTIEYSNSANLNFLSGSTLAPGESSAAADTLTLLGSSDVANRDLNINLATGSNVAIDIFANGTSDSLLVTGSSVADTTEAILNIGTGVNLLLFGTPAFDTPYMIASITDRGEYDASEFADVYLNGGLLTSGDDYNIDYTGHVAGDVSAGSIVVTLIPEPSTIALAMGSVTLLIAGVARRRLRKV